MAVTLTPRFCAVRIGDVLREVENLPAYLVEGETVPRNWFDVQWNVSQAAKEIRPHDRKAAAYLDAAAGVLGACLLSPESELTVFRSTAKELLLRGQAKAANR